jgi:diguanylate cyclase (GGDEF)-like protein
MAYLHKLLVYAKQGVIPQVFSKPFELHEELHNTKNTLESFFKESLKKGGKEDFFIAAYFAEFQLTHKTFMTFYQMEIPNVERTPAEEYGAQITRFVKIINNAVDRNPLFLVMGDALKRLWGYAKGVAEGSLTDNLTGVLNRQGFFHKVAPWLEMMAREKNTFAVFIIDVDHLKKVNEDYNSRTGDKVLRFIAKELNHLCRKSDLLGRYGGEEFIVFLPSVDKKNLNTIAERFRKRIVDKSKTKDILEDGITVSIGGVYGKIQGRNIARDFQKFIEAADTLLNRKVKKSGGNGYSLMKMD